MKGGARAGAAARWESGAEAAPAFFDRYGGDGTTRTQRATGRQVHFLHVWWYWNAVPPPKGRWATGVTQMAEITFMGSAIKPLTMDGRGW